MRPSLVANVHGNQRDEVGGQHGVGGFPGAAASLARPHGTSIGRQNPLPKARAQPCQREDRDPARVALQHMGVHLWCKERQKEKKKNKGK